MQILIQVQDRGIRLNSEAIGFWINQLKQIEPKYYLCTT